MAARIRPTSRDPFEGLPLAARPAQRHDDGRPWQWVVEVDNPALYIVVTRINPRGGQPRGGRLRYEIEVTVSGRTRLHYETSWQAVRDRLEALAR